MANESTSSTLSELYTEIVAEALFVASEKSIMRPLVKNYAISGGGKSVEVPIYAAVSAAAVSEATDLSNTAPRNVAADIGKLFGEAIAKKIDTDLTALFDGFSTAVGSGSTALTAALVFQSIANVRNAGVSMDGVSTVLHPMVAYDLKANLTNTFANANGNDLANEALRNGFVGRLGGVPIYETTNVANDGTAGDYKQGVFHRDALGLAMMQDLKIETQRDASLRADEIVATAVYGVGELNDSYGVELHSDSSIQ